MDKAKTFVSKKLSSLAGVATLFTVMLDKDVEFAKLAVVVITLGVVACVYIMVQGDNDSATIRNGGK
jgi:hypothetical protein